MFLKSLKDRVMLVFPHILSEHHEPILSKAFLTGIACKAWSKEAGPAQELKSQSSSGPEKESTLGSLQQLCYLAFCLNGKTCHQHNQ